MGSLLGYKKSQKLVVECHGFISENGRKTKTHQTKSQQSNIIGSHTASDAKYLFSQREKRQFTPS
jgi:hypothetical protein